MSEIVVKSGKTNITMPWGDDEDVQFTLLDGNGDPIDMTGDEIILGIKEKSVVKCSINGTVSTNEVIFPLYYATFLASSLGVGSFKMDFWNKTKRKTYIDIGSLKFEEVAHEVD